LEKPDLVSRFLSADNAPRSEHTAARLLAAASSHARFPGDVGSTEVQVARLTAKVAALAEHLSTHRKDHSSRRGLQAMLMQRRSLLQYLRRTRFDTYVALIRDLGLKDAPYAPQDRFSLRYKAAPGSGGGKTGGQRS
jgi:small subunit ribosomal protein S15